ncbi:MAG: GPR endopeptidase [Oscillospiraceae bacterium]|nr:GPR endopeptidase [Oscillospiraceae bacterium]MCI9394751.1 GPR endopeptidase [Oscillospiraceae bacterium]
MLQNRRTDLALEAQELWQESAGEQTQLKGVQARDSRQEGYAVTTVRILDQEGAQALGKPAGTYVTLTVDGLARREEDAFGRAVRAVAAELTQLLAGLEGPVLVACLGNRAVTPDAVGPKVHDHLLITRHLVDQAPEHFGAFRPVASVAAGVLGTTGVESGELVGALTGRLKPVCIIAVDALASRSLDRLCRTIQLADTGIAPGSGVGNHRHALDRESLGVPVIAIGVPTVVDGATLAADLLGTADLPPLGREGEMLVTPKDIDSQVNDLAKVIGYGITLALQPGLTLEDMELLMS